MILIHGFILFFGFYISVTLIYTPDYFYSWFISVTDFNYFLMNYK